MPSHRVRSVLAACALVLVAASHPAESKPATIQKEIVESGGQKRLCYVYRPDGVPPDARTPLLILLHGSGRDGASQVKEWRALADREGVLLAAPDARDRSGWAIPADGPELLGDIVTFLKSRYPIDTTRIYLFGHSAGGVFALSVAPMESQLFAAVAVHAGAFRDGSDANVLALASRKIPVLLVVGSRDPYFPVTAVRETKRAFDAAGFPAELVEIPGHDHDYYRRSDEINRKVWTFLSSRHLDTEARYKAYSFK
jgi:poly(3-hydroxybutyrate) depolymerase